MKSLKKVEGLKNVLAVALILLTAVFTGCTKNKKGVFTIEKGKLCIAMEIGYPPFEYYADDTVTPVGFDIILGKEIARRLNLEAVFIDTAFDGILDGLDADRYDIVLSALTITDERLAKYDFTKPYIGNGQSIVIRKDSDLVVNDFKDFDGLRFGFQGASTSDYFCSHIMQEYGITLETTGYEKILTAYDDLKLNRIDAVVSDSLVAVSYLAPKDSEFRQAWVGTPDEYFGICMKKDNAVLNEKINSTFEEIKADGTLSKIYLEVFGMDLSDSIKSYSE